MQKPRRHGDPVCQLIADAVEREGRGSQVRVARAVGVPPPTVNKWVLFENRPDQKYWAKIEESLNLGHHAIAQAAGFVFVDDAKFSPAVIRLAEDLEKLTADELASVRTIVQHIRGSE